MTLQHGMAVFCHECLSAALGFVTFLFSLSNTLVLSILNLRLSRLPSHIQLIDALSTNVCTRVPLIHSVRRNCDARRSWEGTTMNWASMKTPRQHHWWELKRRSLSARHGLRRVQSSFQVVLQRSPRTK